MIIKRPAHQTGRSGEFYVAAELNRRGFDTVTFTGNMPKYDLIALTPDERALYIQVKTQTGSGWALRIADRLIPPTPDMWWVLVLLPYSEAPPRYWVIPDPEMRGILQNQYDRRPHAFDPAKSSGRMCKLPHRAIAELEGGWHRLL